MAGLQRIINACEELNIDRRRVLGVQYTRSEIAKIGETPTRNPWRFNLKISAALPYSTNRDLLETIDWLDRRYTEDIGFSTANGASAGLAYMFAYQGLLNSTIQAQITVNSFSGNQLTLNIPNSVVTGTVVFKQGDLIQIKGYSHPFTVVGPAANSGVITPGDVTVTTTGTLTVTTHRPNFFPSTINLSGLGLNFGKDCLFKMFSPNMPTYKLVPGGSNAIIQWTSDFQLYEYTGEI